MTYETAAGLRQAIETRLNQRARRDRVEVNRLRRGLVFERIMARLDTAEPGEWVVKGGMVLEWRLGGRARATRDVNLVRRGQAVAGPELREKLVDLLVADAQNDRFVFEVGPPQALDVGFRFSVTANLAGKVFASVRLDVATRGEELVATERLQVPSALPAFDRLSPPRVEVASPAQHFAEKLHAFTRELLKALGLPDVPAPRPRGPSPIAVEDARHFAMFLTIARSGLRIGEAHASLLDTPKDKPLAAMTTDAAGTRAVTTGD